DTDLRVKPEELEQRGGAWYSDAAVSLIQSIYGDRRDIHTVNIRNNGTVKGLPDDAVIEVNALVGRHGALPLSVHDMPIHALGLMQSVKAYEQLTIDAVIKKDRALGIQALAVHPLVQSVEQAQLLFDDIVSENSDGEGRSLSMEAISRAKNGDFEGAKSLLEQADEKIAEAHKSQTALIQSEADGDKTEVTLLLIHAQDHLMNAITVSQMAKEFVDLYQKMSGGEAACIGA
ncbi:putative multi-domain containing protein, partial [Aduncisulcus paluster]